MSSRRRVRGSRERHPLIATPREALIEMLVVLEDAGEPMSTTARAAPGYGLSRGLTLTDGPLGQGLELPLLITTNEPLGTLHPAVTRPGRCLAEVEFGPLSAEECNRWLTSATL